MAYYGSSFFHPILFCWPDFGQFYFSLTGFLANFIFFDLFFGHFLTGLFGRPSQLRNGRAKFWKKMAGNRGLFFPAVDQKEKVGQKSASFFVKRNKKTKNGQKSAFLIVKRSKKSKKCIFDCTAQQKIKKWSKKCLFDCKAQQKIKKWSKKCFFDCKTQQNIKNCQKVAGGGVFYPVVFFIRWCFLIQYTQ